MSKHTKGPWEVTPNARGGFTIQSGDGLTVAITPAPWGFTTEDAARIWEKRQNPHLIAAAPDLLKALEQIAAYPKTRADELDASSMRDIARTAIAKAKGENE
jgi:hypothetical protein